MRTIIPVHKSTRNENGDGAASASVGDRPIVGHPPDSGSTGQYPNTIYPLLAAFRFFAFSMGAGLFFTATPTEDVSAALTVILIGGGLYNTFRVLYRLEPQRVSLFIQRTYLAFDAAFAVALILLTDGLNSPFLIYSLAPVLTAGLLMDLTASLTVALVSALSVSGAYVAGSLGVGTFPSILNENYLAFSLLYLAVCLLSGYLPFLANFNWTRRLQQTAQQSERERLRREVHDNVAQTLAFISLKMKRASAHSRKEAGGLTDQDLADIAHSVEQSYLSVRDYLDGTEEHLLEQTLQDSLSGAVNRFSVETGLPVRFNTKGSPLEVPKSVEFQLLQIAREALANSAKHALPSLIWVELDYDASQLTLRVRDNGIGFRTSQPRGHGISIMNERAANIEASLTITAAPRQGTEVAVVYTKPSEAVGE